MKKAEYVKALFALADLTDSLFIQDYFNKKGKLSAKKIAEGYSVNKKAIKFILEVRDHICQTKHS